MFTDYNLCNVFFFFFKTEYEKKVILFDYNNNKKERSKLNSRQLYFFGDCVFYVLRKYKNVYSATS